MVVIACKWRQSSATANPIKRKANKIRSEMEELGGCGFVGCAKPMDAVGKVTGSVGSQGPGRQDADSSWQEIPGWTTSQYR